MILFLLGVLTGALGLIAGVVVFAWICAGAVERRGGYAHEV